jgi:trehalose/maltose hydrolase-like predicted phosphorylase
MSEWMIEYDAVSLDDQPTREALCVLGNGFFATRGAFEETRAGGSHYPGTYLAGGYNRLTSEVSGRQIENEDLVNWPNWLFISFRHEDGDWFDLDRCETLEFSQHLDLKRGVLDRRIRFRDPDGRTSRLHARRFVHMRLPHLAAIEWRLTPEDWSGPVVIRSEIDADVRNEGVKRYRELRGDHLEIERTDVERAGSEGEAIGLVVTRAKQSRLRVAQAMRHRLRCDDGKGESHMETTAEAQRAACVMRLPAAEGESIVLEKVVSLFSSRDWAISEPALEAVKASRRAGSFDELLHSHEREWERLWDQCDITIAGDHDTQEILRLHIFHLLQTASINSIDRDTGVPARGWHGEAYRGHIFWDELFIFPFLTLRLPELTRNLLMYRVRRLQEARDAARDEGFSGAMFPWQSGSNGREESQELHLNPRSGRWIPDTTHRQRHINAAIAYNAWTYYLAAHDEEWLSMFGAELIVEIARFWASIARWNERRERYDIAGVVGPDEYHTDSDATDRPGLLNNAYTNVMASWCIRCAKKALEALPEERCGRLCRDLEVTDDERARWEDVAAKLFIPFHEDDEGRPVISQFEGYESLKEFPWAEYREKYDDIQRLDRVLEAEDKSPNDYKASKQADVLMLFYLFSSQELSDLIGHMGYDFDPKSIPRTVDYYERRTSHGSTLSRVVHAWVTARTQRRESWEFFQAALRSDIDDIQGGTTSEGVHLGAMAGTVDLVQRCYTGVELRDDVLRFNPQLPEELDEAAFGLRYRGHSLRVRVTHDTVEVSSCRHGPRAIRIAVREEIASLKEGETRSFAIEDDAVPVGDDR